MRFLTGMAAKAAVSAAFIVAAAATVVFLWAAPAVARQTPEGWVKSFWATAKSAGISWGTYSGALGGFTPDPDVLQRADSQAEFTMKIWNYLDQMVSDERLSQGKSAVATYATLLGRIEQRYGVDRYIVAAIWGIESHYGQVLSNPKLVKNTIRSLATLAWSGGRLAKYGRKQLVTALKIVQRGDISATAISGSWAGAMGQTQFIPTTFEAFAVDFDGDGHRNIWTSVPDALASTANYLQKSGWQAGQTWGYEVKLPPGFNTRTTSARSLAAWTKLGVGRISGGAFPRPGDKASLWLPNGRDGPGFLLLKNFQVIKRYNASNFYALAVGHLADRLRGGGEFVADWPAHEKPLSLDESKRLQLLLTMHGFYTGDIDGDIGSGSRSAIRDYQRSLGLTPDGVESRDLLQRLEAAK
jgi:membrane-bound lytic murein transglycosylase B